MADWPSWFAVLERWGGMIGMPRRTVSGLGPDVGRHDGLHLTVAHLAGARLDVIAEAIAGALATRNVGGILMVASVVGRAILPPVVLLALCEVLLGRGRAHRRGICLVPFVAVNVVAHLATSANVRIPGPSYAVELMGVIASVGLVLWIRSAVTPVQEDGT